jgi:hypothetical protein
MYILTSSPHPLVSTLLTVARLWTVSLKASCSVHISSLYLHYAQDMFHQPLLVQMYVGCM